MGTFKSARKSAKKSVFANKSAQKSTLKSTFGSSEPICIFSKIARNSRYHRALILAQWIIHGEIQDYLTGPKI